ncbi:MAG: hypothetical protein QM490_05895 [Candidatus Gracilibacteria bacterium]
MNLEKELKKIENKKNTLEKKEIDLIIADFDDTIFCRKEQLDADENLLKFRGKEGNNYIKNVIGIEKFIKKFYINKNYPKTIPNKLRKNHDLILTAGMEEYSKAKLKATNIDMYNYKIVEKAEDKILETIKYVVNILGFIPNKITVFEDRPKIFVEYKKLIEEFFSTKLEIMFVEMSDNYNEPKITKID